MMMKKTGARIVSESILYESGIKGKHALLISVSGYFHVIRSNLWCVCENLVSSRSHPGPNEHFQIHLS